MENKEILLMLCNELEIGIPGQATEKDIVQILPRVRLIMQHVDRQALSRILSDGHEDGWLARQLNRATAAHEARELLNNYLDKLVAVYARS